MNKLVLASLIGFGMATPALAQDEATPVGGFRVEALTGWDDVVVSVDEDVYGEKVSDGKSGLFYGAAAGYDFAMGDAIIGVEAELADSTAGTSARFDEVVNGYDVNGKVSLDASRDIYIGARLGGMIGGRTLVYVKGGYTNARLALKAKGTIDGVACSLKESANFDGFRVGLGAERFVTSNAYVKMEYRYSSYSDGGFDRDGEDYDLGDLFDDGKLERHQVLVGVGYKF